MITANARFWLIAALVAGVLIYLLGPVLTPFVIGALLAYLGDPLVDRMERWSVAGWRIGRTGAVVLVFLALVLVLVLAVLLLLPMLEKQIGRLIAGIPGYLAWFQNTAVPWFSERLGVDVPDMDRERLTEMFSENWQNAGGVATGILAGVTRSGAALVSWAINLVLIPVVAFYLMRDWNVLVPRLRALLPRRNEPTVTQLARESDQVLGAFLRGQLLVMLALATMYSVGLSLLGVDLALLIGLVAGLISFVPYLGTIVGVGMALVASLVQYGELWHVAAVGAVFAVGQAIEGMVLQPLLIGDRIGLHPVAVIFAVMVGGQLFGFIGVLVALPVAAVLVVVLGHLLRKYKASEVYSADAGPEAEASRLVLPDDDNAVVVVEGDVAVDGQDR